MVKISVIIPVYNVAPYIEQCVRSLMEQTQQDVEYVFVDDCTPDDSMKILCRVLEDYPDRKMQVKILHNKTNRGASLTRRAGLGACTGEYIICVDADDYVAPNYLEMLYDKAVKEKADIVWCDFFRQYGRGVEADKADAMGRNFDNR